MGPYPISEQRQSHGRRSTNWSAILSCFQKNNTCNSWPWNQHEATISRLSATSILFGMVFACFTKMHKFMTECGSIICQTGLAGRRRRRWQQLDTANHGWDILMALTRSAKHIAVCFRMTPFNCFVSCCVITREVAETAWLSSGFRFFRRDHPATQLWTYSLRLKPKFITAMIR